MQDICTRAISSILVIALSPVFSPEMLEISLFMRQPSGGIKSTTFSTKMSKQGLYFSTHRRVLTVIQWRDVENGVFSFLLGWRFGDMCVSTADEFIPAGPDSASSVR